MRGISIAQPAEPDEGAASDSTVVYVNVRGVRIAVSLIGPDLHRLETVLAELLDGWKLRSVHH
jgi:hypothetical protein